MKRLILMRHAKSSWAEAGQADRDRPLDARGRRDAPRIGAWLVARGDLPDAALVSTAARTRETRDRLGPDFGAVPTTLRPDLYHAAPEAMLAALRQGPEAPRLLMLGHQPGIGGFARRLLAEAPADPDLAKFPTAAVAVIDFDLDAWKRAGWGGGRLVDFVVPRSLG